MIVIGSDLKGTPILFEELGSLGSRFGVLKEVVQGWEGLDFSKTSFHPSCVVTLNEITYSGLPGGWSMFSAGIHQFLNVLDKQSLLVNDNTGE